MTSPDYCNMDCKTKIKPTRIISKEQTWFKFTLALYHPAKSRC